jgi:8-oxo-dGTP pyrophosphatase MutT (NUDIX family)
LIMLRTLVRSLLCPLVISLLAPSRITHNNSNGKVINFRMISDTIHNSKTLSYMNDRYDGVIVDASQLPSDDEEFKQLLLSSLEEWKLLKKRGIWLKLPIDKSAYVPIAVNMGFTFHHAEKEHVMMTTWLSEEENHMPPNASHQVGVGCVVISPDKKLLLVQERSGLLKGTGIWKLPTGLVEAGEDIPLAACREVKEETGVDTTFVSLLCFRQSHNVSFGKSDLFFVCILEPTSTEITPQASEIVACEWLEPSAYFNQEFFSKSELFSKLNNIIKDAVNDDVTVVSVDKFNIGWRPGHHSLYHIKN